MKALTGTQITLTNVAKSVSTVNMSAQRWIYDPSNQYVKYLSFVTPIGGIPLKPVDGGGESPPQYCGKAVFSDLHVAGNPSTNDTSPPPGGCDNVDLSPQEKALEFMLFDLSSCVIPDTVAPPIGVPIQ